MPVLTIIDGNNLLYEMHAHAPLPHVGRETLVRVLEGWAGKADDEVLLVFDGPVPRGGMAAQLMSRHIEVRFSGPETADAVIVAALGEFADRPDLRVVTSDRAIQHAARARKRPPVACVAFIRELFRTEDPSAPTPADTEKPAAVDAAEADDWIESFGLDQADDPLDDYDAMTR